MEGSGEGEIIAFFPLSRGPLKFSCRFSLTHILFFLLRLVYLVFWWWLRMEVGHVLVLLRPRQARVADALHVTWGSRHKRWPRTRTSGGAFLMLDGLPPRPAPPFLKGNHRRTRGTGDPSPLPPPRPRWFVQAMGQLPGAGKMAFVGRGKLIPSLFDFFRGIWPGQLGFVFGRESRLGANFPRGDMILAIGPQLIVASTILLLPIDLRSNVVAWGRCRTHKGPFRPRPQRGCVHPRPQTGHLCSRTIVLMVRNRFQ